MDGDMDDQLSSLQAALGPVGPLLREPDVTDILINGDDGVWVDRGQGVQSAGLSLSDDRTVRRLAVRLAAMSGARLDDASPWVDGLLPGGVRLHAVLPPLVGGGAHISLRVRRSQTPMLDDLRRWGALDRVADQVVRAVVAARSSFLVTGGTGSGKTTLLAAMLAVAGDLERIVVVEDVRELAVRHPHVVYLQGRANNVEGRGEVTLTTLVRQSLRMRPDRIVVGEVRGAEVRELLSALNTGHEGGCGTVHANAAGEVVSRMEALGALAGMSPSAVHAQLRSAVQVVLHVARLADGRRVLAEVAVVRRDASGEVSTVTGLRRGAAGWAAGPAWEDLVQELSLPGLVLQGGMVQHRELLHRGEPVQQQGPVHQQGPERPGEDASR